MWTGGCEKKFDLIISFLEVEPIKVAKGNVKYFHTLNMNMRKLIKISVANGVDEKFRTL